MRAKLIIVEGPQGTGKTTLTDYLRHSLPYTNLYRLSGTADSSETGLAKSIKMYEDLIRYLKMMEGTDINLVFDRTFFTEENYCRNGFKEYSFTEEYNKLVKKLDKLDFDIYYINLYLDDVSKFEERLNRSGKALYKYAPFKIESSIKQQETYCQMSDELKKITKNINVIDFNVNRPVEEEYEELNKLLGIESKK